MVFRTRLNKMHDFLDTNVQFQKYSEAGKSKNKFQDFSAPVRNMKN